MSTISEDFALLPRLLTVSEAAQYLGCSERNVYSLMQSGAVPYIEIGRKKGYRLDRADLDGFIEARKKQKAAASTRMPRPRLKHIRLSPGS